MRLLAYLFCVLPVLGQQDCQCASTSIVQKIWSAYDTIFWGNIEINGNVMQATVHAPVKGCLLEKQNITLVVDSKCPGTLAAPALKAGRMFLITGRKTGVTVKIDKCGWTKPRQRISDADAYWLSNQFEKCNGRPVCRNSLKPLTCDESNCNLGACAGSAICEANPCHNCALQYLTADSKLKCGELGGAEFEKRLCPLCEVDPCTGATPCKGAPKNAVCLSNSCLGCDRPLWVDDIGRQVCQSKSTSQQCAEYGSILFKPRTCTTPQLLGYASMNNVPCSPVMGCLPLPKGVTLYDKQDKCLRDCTCVDFSKVDMRYNASDSACNQNLGWALVRGKCAKVQGCAAVKSASPVSSSIYTSETVCKTACGTKLKSYTVKNGRPNDWVEAANGEKVKPQYSTVFPRNKVNRMDFTFEPTVWQAMQADLVDVMTSYANSAGVGRRLLSVEDEPEDKGFDELEVAADVDVDADIDSLLKELFPGDDAKTPEITDEEDTEYRRRRSQRRNLIDVNALPPTSAAEALAMDRALAKIFAGDANPDGSCRPLCGSGGSCPIRRDSNDGLSFGFNERGVVLSRDPANFPVTITAQGNTWHGAEIRFKGGSSLTGAYFMQSKMLPFRVSMDGASKTHPEIKGQKFFGFSKLTFSNNWMERSHVREILSYEILGASGVRAPRATPVRIYFDYGEGPVFWGLYTMIEEPTDTVVLNFDNDTHPGDGNIYKPENNTWDKFVEEDFEKKNNEKANDFSDVQAAFNALHAPNRLTAPEVWRRNLEAVFDVVTFLRVLAGVSLVGNWDTYGLMPHNYLLYNVNGRLTWIPWDFNLALNCDDRTTSIFKVEIGDQWPLISFLLADRYYRGLYTTYVQWLITSGPFVAKDIIKRKDQLIDLVTPHVMGQNGFEAEVAPHTTMYKPEMFPLESAKIGVYINQRISIAQRELQIEASRLRAAAGR